MCRSRLCVSLTAVGALLLLSSVATAQQTVPVRGLAFSPDGKLLAVGTGDPKGAGAVSLWEVTTRKRLWNHLEMAGGVPTVAFAPDGKKLAIGVYDGAARLLDVTTGKVEASLDHPKEVRSVAFAPDGKRLATACWDKIVRVWDIASAKELIQCAGHRNKILAVEFSPDGKLLLSVAGDDGAKLWHADSGAEKHTLKHYYMPCAGFSADGRWVVTGSYDGTTRIWDVESGKERARLSGTGGIHVLSVSGPARMVAVAHSRPICLFEMNLDQPAEKDLQRIRALLARFDDDSYDVREATGRELLQIGFLAEAELSRAAKEASSAEVRIRARRLRQEMLGQPRITLHGHTEDVLGLAFSPDGKLLASGSQDGTLRLWDLASQKELACLPGTVSFSPSSDSCSPCALFTATNNRRPR